MSFILLGGGGETHKWNKGGRKEQSKMLKNVSNGEKVGRINRERRQKNDKAIWQHNS
jgi:hypothetical protein